MWLSVLLPIAAICILPALGTRAPESREKLICFQCSQIDHPENCRLVTSKCDKCMIVNSGGRWDLGCGPKSCQAPECCDENLCNGKIVCPIGQRPNPVNGQCINCGNCLSGVSCDPSTGRCPSGCEAGWFGDSCDQTTQVTPTPTPGFSCPPGRYGTDCANFCSGRCHLGSVCDGVTGECPVLNGMRCVPGYQGNRCDQECDAGRYGSECLNGCSENCYNRTVCYPDSGFCPILTAGSPRCAAGWEGAFCMLDCERGRWGEDCTHVCSPHCWDYSPCDAVTGVCEVFDGKPRCASGWYGEKCDEQCPRGMFGEDCLQNCTGQCYRGAACDPVTGYCPVTSNDPRCAAGWRGETCEISCPHDRYGEDCVQVCSSNCRDGGLCNGITGFCPLVEGQPRCEDGWTGAKCDQVCSTGEACVQTCTQHCYSPNACDPDTGVCSVIGPNPRCTSGWFGDRCDKPCPPGTHGVDCGELCSGHCYHMAACDRVNGTCPEFYGRARCEAGWQGETCDLQCAPQTFGADCNSLCPGQCYNDTACDIFSGSCPRLPGLPRCRAGWQNPYCDQRCVDGRYGEDCIHVCSGQCYNGVACDAITGECPLPDSGPRCEAGFFGSSCEWACLPGTYGEDCKQLCSGHCYQAVSCEPVTGRCPKIEGVRKCAAGYQGEKCDTVCEAGTFGENCLQTCGMCLQNQTCNVVSGICPAGCQPGFNPPLCK